MSWDKIIAEVTSDLMFVWIVERTTHTDLDRVGSVYEAFFESAAEWCAVVILLTEYFVTDVGVGVKVNHSDWAVLLCNCTHFTECDGMVAAEADWNDTSVNDWLEFLFDCFVCRMNVAWCYVYITVVSALEVFKDVNAHDNVIWLHHSGDASDSGRTETGAGAVRRSCVKWNTENSKVEVFCFCHVWDTHECTCVTETWG